MSNTKPTVVEFTTRFRPGGERDWGWQKDTWVAEPKTLQFGAYLGSAVTEAGAIMDLQWKIETERKIKIELKRI